MWRLLRVAGLALGVPLALGLALAVLLAVARYAQLRLVGTGPGPERVEEKARYLAALPEVDPARVPSFVLILFDDLGYGDLSSYGSRLIRTPALDRAADEGLRMTDFYSPSPVCTPARAGFLTGRLPPRTHTDRHVFFPEGSLTDTVRGMLGWARALPTDEITLAEALGAAGYATGMVGKWHLGDLDGHRPNDFGFGSFFGVMHSNDMFPLHLWRDREIVQRDARDGDFWGERDEERPIGPGGVDQTELTEAYTREAIAFVEANRERPFFLYLAHTFPHVPHYPAPAYAGSSPGGRYGDVVEDLDRSTGALLAALDRLGLSGRTAVFVTSDNGADYGGSPGALRGRKGEILEGGQRVPMIVRWPGRVGAGRVSDAPAMGTDLFPTLLELAGLPLPEDRVIDGRSLVPLLSGADRGPHEFLWFFPPMDSLPGAVRAGDFKYLRRTGDLGRDRGHLTRLDADAEAHDLRSLHPEQAERLADALERKSEELAANPRGWR